MMDIYNYDSGLPHGYDPYEGLTDEERVKMTCLVLMLYMVGIVVAIGLCMIFLRC